MAAREQNSGNLNGYWGRGDAAEVKVDSDIKDGYVWVYLSEDWDNRVLDPPAYQLERKAKYGNIPVGASIMESCLQLTAVVIMHGKQCAPLHLHLVTHVRDWIWGMTSSTDSSREVEGSGRVDYINIIWCIDSCWDLYSAVTREVGLYKHQEGEQEWDSHWYIYRREQDVPSYAHIGLDRSATLKIQTHMADVVKLAITESLKSAIQTPRGSQGVGVKKRGSAFSRLFGKNKN